MIRKFSAILIGTALFIGATGCGPREPLAGERPDTQSADAGTERDRNIVGAIGVGVLTTMVTNGLAMGLGAIPGMPKEITALFGGGGSDNTEVLKAIAAVAEQIRQLDAKVDQVLANVQTLDDKVASLAAQVQKLAEQQCASAKYAREAEIKDIITLVNSVHATLYAPSTGIARATIERIKNSNDPSTRATDDALVELAGQYDLLKANPKFGLVFETLSDTLLGGQNDQAGLVSHMMYCTIQAKRFLTKSDTEQWSNYVQYFVIEAAKALQLTAFVEGFDAYKNNRVLNLDKLNRAAINFEQLARALLYMTQNQIPVGQILDTKTNKMWTAGGRWSRLDVERASDALRECVSDGPLLENIARNPGASLNPNAVERLKDCVSTATLDSDGEAGQWRIPQIFELSKTSDQSPNATVSWAPPSLVGLIDGWGDAKICDNGASFCRTPSQYLAAAGAATLVNRYSGGLQYVWSNTSLAAARGPRNRATNAVMVENDKSMDGPNGFVNVSGYHYNGGWLSGSQFSRDYDRSCREEFNVNPVDSQRFNQCRTDFGNDEMGVRCRSVMGGNPMPFSMASVQVANLGVQDLPRSYSSSSGKIIGESAGSFNIQPGKLSTFFAAKSYFAQYFACGTFHKDCDWLGSCSKWETKDYEVTLPQLAQVLFVRDLMPGERYYFTDRGSDTRSWVERAKFEAPAVRVTLAANGRTRINALPSQQGRAVDARCVVDPATAPKRFTELPATSTSCSVSGAFRLKPGPHTVYAMVRDAVSTNLESQLSVTQLSVGGEAPAPATGIRVKADNQSVKFDIASMNADYDYYGEAVAVGQQAAPSRCKIDVDTKTCTIGQLVNNTKYSTKVITYFGVLKSDSDTTEVIPFGAPRAPVATVAHRGNGTIDVAVESPDSAAIKTPVSRFELWIDGSKVSECDAANQPSTCRLTGLDNSVVYAVTAKAINDFGETVGVAPVAAQPLAPPSAPGTVTVTGARGVINVFWDRESEGGSAAAYTASAYLSTGGPAVGSCRVEGTTRNSTVIVVPDTKCNIPNLDGEKTYRVSVVASNDGGDSAATVAGRTVRPLFTPGVPTVVASVRDARVFVTATPGQTNNQTGSTKSIKVTSNLDGLTCTVVLPATECEIVGGSRDRNYTFRGVATNDTGDSTPSELSNAVLVYNPPSVPTIVSTDNGKSKITVTMERSLTEAVDGYIATASPGGATCTAVVPNLTCDITGLTNGTGYTVSVRAYNNGGLSTATAATPTITPIPEPARPALPTVTLGRGQATVTVRTSSDNTITRYVVKMVDDNVTCEILLPAKSCTITGLETGFAYEFTATAYNKIGPSVESQKTAPVTPLDAPLAPIDAILTTSFSDIIVEVLPDPDSAPATKYSVAAEPGGYKCEATAAIGKCVLRGAARGASYTISATATNSGGVSQPMSRVFYLTAPPTAPSDVEISASATALVVGFDAASMNDDTTAVRVTASPGGKSCTITLPATTCGIDTDTTKAYVMSSVSIGEGGEESSTIVKTKSIVFVDAPSSVELPAATASAGGKVVEVVEVESSSKPPAEVVDAVVPGSEVAPVAVVELAGGKKKDSNTQLSAVFDTLSRTTLKKLKVSKFSASVAPSSAKTCRIDGSAVTALKPGTCSLRVTYLVAVKKTKVKKTLTTQVHVG